MNLEKEAKLILKIVNIVIWCVTLVTDQCLTIMVQSRVFRLEFTTMERYLIICYFTISLRRMTDHTAKLPLSVSLLYIFRRLFWHVWEITLRKIDIPSFKREWSVADMRKLRAVFDKNSWCSNLPVVIT